MKLFTLWFILVIVTCHIILRIIYALFEFAFDKLLHKHYITLEVTFLAFNCFDNSNVYTVMIDNIDKDKILPLLKETYKNTDLKNITLVKIKKRHHFK